MYTIIAQNYLKQSFWKKKTYPLYIYKGGMVGAGGRSCPQTPVKEYIL